MMWYFSIPAATSPYVNVSAPKLVKAGMSQYFLIAVFM